ncbi:hypothetical protein J3A83DRAFT_67572 [Scleroderma citrinum]
MQLHLWPSRPRSLYHTQLHLHLPCRTNRLGLSSFLEGTMTRLPADQMLHAKCMLDSTKWTFSHICALAQRFSWKCTTPNTYGSIARTILILYGHQLFSSPRIALEAFDYARSTVRIPMVIHYLSYLFFARRSLARTSHQRREKSMILLICHASLPNAIKLTFFKRPNLPMLGKSVKPCALPRTFPPLVDRATGTLAGTGQWRVGSRLPGQCKQAVADIVNPRDFGCAPRNSDDLSLAY